MEVKPFKVLLAAKAPPIAEIRYPVLGSPKYDGVRAYVKGGRLMSRKGLPIPNTMLQDALGSQAFEGFDGELICGDPCAKDVFNKSTRMCMGRDADVTDAIFFVFDKFDVEGGFQERLQRARAHTGPKGQTLVGDVGISVVPHKIIKNSTELEVLEAEVIKQGFEGLMIRSIDGAYKQGRSTVREGYLMKVKQFAHDEAEIFGAFEQMENTNEATIGELGQTKRSSHKAGKVGKGTLGGFHVKMMTGDFKGVAVDVGTGWTDNERQALWDDWQKYKADKFPGLRTFRERYGLLRVKHQLAGAKDKPRFPIADGWRNRDDT